MSFTTFSGPVRSGTVREGASLNTGLMVLAQSATIPTAQILTSPTAQNLFILPAGSKVLYFEVEVTATLTTATNCGVTIGKAGTANFYATTFNTGTAIGQVSPATVGAATVSSQTDNIGTSDMQITGTFTAATGNAATGSIVVTCVYVQRTSAGVANPSQTY